MSDLFPTEMDREWADATLLDSCTAYRESTAEPTWDDDTGRAVYSDDTVAYQGPCSVSYGVSDRRVTEGANPQVLGEWVIRVPIAVTSITSGCVVVVDAIHAGGDPGLAGRSFTVRRVGARSSAVLRRLFADEMVRTSP